MIHCIVILVPFLCFILHWTTHTHTHAQEKKINEAFRLFLEIPKLKKMPLKGYLHGHRAKGVLNKKIIVCSASQCCIDSSLHIGVLVQDD